MPPPKLQHYVPSTKFSSFGPKPLEAQRGFPATQILSRVSWKKLPIHVEIIFCVPWGLVSFLLLTTK